MRSQAGASMCAPRYTVRLARRARPTVAPSRPRARLLRRYAAVLDRDRDGAPGRPARAGQAGRVVRHARVSRDVHVALRDDARRERGVLDVVLTARLGREEIIGRVMSPCASIRPPSSSCRPRAEETGTSADGPAVTQRPGASPGAHIARATQRRERRAHRTAVRKECRSRERRLRPPPAVARHTQPRARPNAGAGRGLWRVPTGCCRTWMGPSPRPFCAPETAVICDDRRRASELDFRVLRMPWGRT